MKEDILHSSLKEIQVFGDIKSHKAEIDAEDMAWILQILSTNLYSDPIGSLIREYSSNAWDANVEANNKSKPIEVGIQTTKDGGTYWYVTDLGPGLSPQRIDTIYRKFGKSTKRNSNEAIGMMGLGKFSGLSYTNEIFISTRVDGIQYEYLMHKSDNLPQIDLLVTKLTDLPNGTTIKVNIKDWQDKGKFISKTQEQLAFFENVFFNIDARPNLNSDFKLIQGTSFTSSSLEDRGLRLKIGPVSYPIDWDLLKDKSLRSLNADRLALNFSIGELAITPNRESVLYNKKTIENIEKRLEEFKLELIELYNNKIQEFEDNEIDNYLEAIRNPSVFIGGYAVRIQNLLLNANVKIKPPLLKNLGVAVYPDNYQELMYGFKNSRYISNGRKTVREFSSINRLDDTRTKTIIIKKNQLNVLTTKYLCDSTGKSNWYTIYRTKRVRLFAPGELNNKYNYYSLLKLKHVPKSKWRETIVKFQKWQDAYVEKYTVDYDKVQPTKEWLLDNKTSKSSANNKTSLRKSSGKLLVKVASQSQHSVSSAVFRNEDWPLNTLEKKRKLMVYGTEEDKDKLQMVFAMSFIVPNLLPIITAKSNHKYFKDLSQFVEINTYLTTYQRSTAKLVSIYRLFQTHKEHESFYFTSNLIEKLRPNLSKLIKSVYDVYYLYKQQVNHRFTYVFRDNWEKFIEGFEKTAVEKGYLDYKLEAVGVKYIKYAKMYNFLIHVKDNNSSTLRTYSKTQTAFAVELCRFKKTRMALEYYQNKQENGTIADSNTEQEESTD